MDDIHVEFRHYRVELEEDALGRLGSRYFARKEAGKQLRKWLLKRLGAPHEVSSLTFSAKQLACANEVFPEAALADPIADLQVWDEWRSGLRRFPYPGVYTRLDIKGQERKTSATSSVGVLGELLTGLFSQSYIAPLVVVRPIRRWPDFIYLGADQRYSFVESKASASLDRPRPAGLENVAEDLLAEGLADAVQELNADPFLHVWLAFTDFWEVQPVRANVCILEAEAPETRRIGKRARVPDAVTDGLAERLLMASAAELESEPNDSPSAREKEPTRQSAGDAEAHRPRAPAATADRDLRGLAKWRERLRDRAADRAAEIAATSVPLALQKEAVAEIRRRITAMRVRKVSAGRPEGKRLHTARRCAANGRLAALRLSPTANDEWLMLADLDPAALVRLHHGWEPDWSRAPLTWGTLRELALWRCSSAVLAVGTRGHEGDDVSEAKCSQSAQVSGSQSESA